MLQDLNALEKRFSYIVADLETYDFWTFMYVFVILCSYHPISKPCLDINNIEEPLIKK